MFSLSLCELLIYLQIRVGEICVTVFPFYFFLNTFLSLERSFYRNVACYTLPSPRMLAGPKPPLLSTTPHYIETYPEPVAYPLSFQILYFLSIIPIHSPNLIYLSNLSPLLIIFYTLSYLY